jgi:hypothetical protein
MTSADFSITLHDRQEIKDRIVCSTQPDHLIVEMFAPNEDDARTDLSVHLTLDDALALGKWLLFCSQFNQDGANDQSRL